MQTILPDKLFSIFQTVVKSAKHSSLMSENITVHTLIMKWKYFTFGDRVLCWINAKAANVSCHIYKYLNSLELNSQQIEFISSGQPKANRCSTNYSIKTGCKAQRLKSFNTYNRTWKARFEVDVIKMFSVLHSMLSAIKIQVGLFQDFDNKLSYEPMDI